MSMRPSTSSSRRASREPCWRRLRCAGSVFLGAWSPESMGDYCSGTNHVLAHFRLCAQLQRRFTAGVSETHHRAGAQRRRPACARTYGHHALRAWKVSMRMAMRCACDWTALREPWRHERHPRPRPPGHRGAQGVFTRQLGSGLRSAACQRIAVARGNRSLPGGPQSLSRAASARAGGAAGRTLRRRCRATAAGPRQ